MLVVLQKRHRWQVLDEVVFPAVRMPRPQPWPPAGGHAAADARRLTMTSTELRYRRPSGATERTRYYAQTGAALSQRLNCGVPSSASLSRASYHSSRHLPASLSTEPGSLLLRATKPGNIGLPVGCPVG